MMDAISVLISHPVCGRWIAVPVAVDGEGMAEESTVIYEHHCPVVTERRVICQLTVRAGAEQAAASWRRVSGNDRYIHWIFLPTPRNIARVLSRKKALVAGLEQKGSS